MLKCKKCASTSYIKSGHVRGLQRYRCKACNCQFTNTKRRGVHPAIKSLAIVLYSHCGMSMLGIAKLFGVSAPAVLKWIRHFSDTITLPEQKAEIVQMDEMWHFVNGKKNTIWIWRAVDGVSRRSVGWRLGSRSDACLQPLVQQIDDGKCTFVTDEWGGFFRLLPEDRHFFGKDLTFPIEATNSDIRHRLARFKRRTKASSRSIDMVNRSLLIFHHFQDYPENLQPMINQFLTFFS